MDAGSSLLFPSPPSVRSAEESSPDVPDNDKALKSFRVDGQAPTPVSSPNASTNDSHDQQQQEQQEQEQPFSPSSDESLDSPSTPFSDNNDFSVPTSPGGTPLHASLPRKKAKPRVPLTAIETLGKTLIQGDSTQKTNVHSFLEQLGLSGSNFDKYKDRSKKKSSSGSSKRRRSKNRHGKKHSGRSGSGSEKKAKKLRKLKHNNESSSSVTESLPDPSASVPHPCSTPSPENHPVRPSRGGVGGSPDGKHNKQALQAQQQNYHHHHGGQVCGGHCRAHHHHHQDKAPCHQHHPASSSRVQPGQTPPNGRSSGQKPKSPASASSSKHSQPTTGGGSFSSHCEPDDMMIIPGNRKPSSSGTSSIPHQYGRNVDPRKLPQLPFPNPSTQGHLQPFQPLPPMGRIHRHQPLQYASFGGESTVPLHQHVGGSSGSAPGALWPKPPSGSSYGEQARQGCVQPRQQLPFDAASSFTPGATYDSAETIDDSLLSFLNDTTDESFPWLHANPLPQQEDLLIDEMLVNGYWNRRDQSTPQGQEQEPIDSNVGPNGQMLVSDLNTWFS